jgi:hypothetical protein
MSRLLEILEQLRGAIHETTYEAHQDLGDSIPPLSNSDITFPITKLRLWGTFLFASMTSMLIALITAPALLATSEAIRQGQSKDRKEEHRARRSNLVVSCVDSSPLSLDIDHRQVALKNNKVSPISARNMQRVLTFLFSYM